MTRLNQLQLVDETKLGLALVWCYMVLDAASGRSFGGWHLLKAAGIVPEQWMIGLLQVGMLFGFTAVFGALKLRRVRIRLGLREAKDVDSRLAADADYLGLHLARGRPRFLVTRNVFDANAFCVATTRAPWIVLGGGLRLLLRRDREQALAVVAHECAHVAADDIIYLLITWYTFLAYVCLTGLGLILSQLAFWVLVPEGDANYRKAGLRLLDLLRDNASRIFLSGGPELIGIVGVAIALVHFVKQREYRADEATGLTGRREALIGVLATRLEHGRHGIWRALAKFHPEASRRVERLRNERAWANLDWLFVASMAFVWYRLDAVIPSWSQGLDFSTLEGSDQEERLEVLLRYMATDYSGFVSFVLTTMFAFIVSLHAYRVAATQYKLGDPLLGRIATSAEVGTALFVGAFVGHITSPKVLTVVTSKGLSALAFVDGALSAAAFISIFGLWLALALVLLCSIALRRSANSSLRQGVGLYGGALALAFVIQLLAGLPLMIGLYFDVHFPLLEISWLPVTSAPLFPGYPSVLDLALTMAVALALLRVVAQLSLRGSGEGKLLKIHPSRLAVDTL